MAFAAVAGAVVGGLMGGGSGSESQTQTREPWKGVQPWLLSNIDQGQALQNYYQQNPFNQIQQAAMQGLLDNYNRSNQVNNGLMSFADQLMNTNYQRTQQPANYLSPYANRSSQPGLMNYNLPQINAQQGGSSQLSGLQQLPAASQGAFGQASKSPTQYFGGTTGTTGTTGTSVSPGQIDWNAMNPFYKDPSATPESKVPTDEDALRTLMGNMLFPDPEGSLRRVEMSDAERYLRQVLNRPDNRTEWLYGDGG